MCENCSMNAWNYDSLNGCTLCDCSSIGADGPNCNPENGQVNETFKYLILFLCIELFIFQCNCRVGFEGLKCDRCIHGYFNFPKCELCNCDLSGTDPTTCKNNACLCNETGQCNCKVIVFYVSYS